jgi:hypothetical protein
MKKLIFDKHTENLVEIAMAFAALVSKYTKLTDTDSVAWKQKFVEWANEFEDKYGEVEDFDVELGRSYLEVVADFAKEKILEYGGVEECR